MPNTEFNVTSHSVNLDRRGKRVMLNTENGEVELTFSNRGTSPRLRRYPDGGLGVEVPANRYGDIVDILRNERGVRLRIADGGEVEFVSGSRRPTSVRDDAKPPSELDERPEIPARKRMANREIEGQLVRELRAKRPGVEGVGNLGLELYVEPGPPEDLNVDDLQVDGTLVSTGGLLKATGEHGDLLFASQSWAKSQAPLSILCSSTARRVFFNDSEGDSTIIVYPDVGRVDSTYLTADSCFVDELVANSATVEASLDANNLNAACVNAGRAEISDDNGVTIKLDGDNARLTVGRSGNYGIIRVFGSNNKSVARLDGNGCIDVGGNGTNGRIHLFPSDATDHSSSKASLILDGDTGDIKLAGADCAEEFDLGLAEVDPGTVLTISASGKLVPCSLPGDRRVAGIVSGAGEHRPALILDRNPSDSPRAVVALSGKTHCWVDAGFGAVRPGDLLVTSSTPGHAMRAPESTRMSGAVIGKALSALDEGRGLVTVLVSLQ